MALNAQLNVHFGPKMSSYYIDSAVCTTHVVDENKFMDPLCSVQLESSQRYQPDSLVNVELDSTFHSIDYSQARDLLFNDTRQSVAFSFSCVVYGRVAIFGSRRLTVPVSLHQYNFKTPELSLVSTKHKDATADEEKMKQLSENDAKGYEKEIRSNDKKLHSYDPKGDKEEMHYPKTAKGNSFASMALEELSYHKLRYYLSFR